MKVVLINPTFHTYFPIGLSYGEPLGLAYIAAAIERDSPHQVDIVDSVGLSTHFEKVDKQMRIGLPADELLALIAEKKADAYGVSLITSLYSEEILDFIGKLKALDPSKPVIVGGAHASLEWQECIKHPAVDFIVLGEGEGTIVDLLAALNGEKALKDVDGIIFKDERGVGVQTAPRKAIDIDSLPLPARHLLPMHNYLRLRPSYYYMRQPVASIITSRACPFKCIFCSTTLLWGRKYRGASPKKVVDEMEYLQKTYGVREFLINDDSFSANKKRTMAICDEIIARKLNIRYQIPPGVNLHLLDEQLLVKLKKSGLYIINPQFETGNVRTIEYIRKPIDLEQGKEVLDIANRIGLWTKTNIILGFPHETREDIEETIRFAENLNVDAINFLVPMVYRHTDLGKDYIDLGLIDAAQTAALTCNSLHLTKEELEGLREQAIRRFNRARVKRFLSIRYLVTNFLPKLADTERLMLFLRRMMFGAFRPFYRNL